MPGVSVGGANTMFAMQVPDGSGGNVTMVMDALGGRDQIVATAARSSWLDFERPLPAMFHVTVARNPGVVIDVGANTGFYACLAFFASRQARVVAFEPYRAVFEVLGRNIAANRARGRIEPVPRALSSACGIAALYVPTQEHGLMETSASLEQAFKEAHSEAQSIETVTLDAFLATHPCVNERVTLIKMDVEGHEAAVLAGARRTIARWRPLLFIEVLPPADTATLMRFLAEDNYVDMPLRPNAALRPEQELRFHPDAWNHALVPAEAVASFLLEPTAF